MHTPKVRCGSGSTIYGWRSQYGAMLTINLKKMNMKKLVLMFVALFSMSVSVFADGLTATLQQGDVMTPFYGVDAYKQAYEAATDGAVITLSSGSFNTVSNLAKSVTVVGVCAFYGRMERTILNAGFTISANNVKLEGIYCDYTISLGTVTNCHVRRCYVNTLTSSSTHTNTLVDQSVIRTEKAIKNSKNYTIQNSTIECFTEINSSSNIANISNCYISYWYRRGYSDYKQPIAIYRNNVLGLNNSSSNANYSDNNTISLSSPSEFYYNYFYRYNSYSSSYEAYCTTPNYATGCVNIGNSNSIASSPYKSSFSYPNKEASFGNGQDGTPRGIMGGNGFSEYPDIPRIVGKQIDANTNAEGKINVKITVKTK